MNKMNFIATLGWTRIEGKLKLGKENNIILLKYKETQAASSS